MRVVFTYIQNMDRDGSVSLNYTTQNTWIFSKCKSYIHEHTTIFEDVTNRFHETLDNIQSFVPFKIRTVGSFLKENPGMHQISFHPYVFSVDL